MENVNREIAVFEGYFRRFFRGEDRSNLQSALFNVPGRLVAGCWADYENMGAVFEQLLATISAEQIGRRMKKTAARPGIFQPLNHGLEVSGRRPTSSTTSKRALPRRLGAPKSEASNETIGVNC